MAGSTLGPMCSTKCGPDWIDDGTTCRSKSEPWAPLGVYVGKSADDLAKQTVLNTLSDLAIAKIRFTIDSYHVSPGMYSKVAQLVGNGRIRVEYNWSVGTAAYYYPVENKIELGLTSASTLTKQAKIVHECTHAAFDVHRYARSTIATSEAAGFVAECLFARVKSPKTDDPDYRIYSDDEKKDFIYELAWEIAGKILQGQTPKSRDYSALKEAVLTHPDYKHGRSLSGWNGV